MHLYECAHSLNGLQMVSKSGRIFYLERPADQGRPAYTAHVYGEFAGDQVPRYELQDPSGSRSDVKARGHWKNGQWTIEFARLLDTGHPDDVPFDPALSYQFGIS